MEINIKRIDDAFKLQAENEAGIHAFMDGSKSIGGKESAFRPMQMLVFSLASCSAIDVISILNKQRQKIETFDIQVTADRTDGVPSTFKRIEVHFKLTGEIKAPKLAKAIELSTTKYCSVQFSLHPDIEINYSYSLNSSDKHSVNPQ